MQVQYFRLRTQELPLFRNPYDIYWFAINVRKYFSILGGSASFPWWFSFVFIFCLFLAVNKVDIRLRSIPSTSAYNIYFTFQFIIFERHSFENNNETNIFLRSSDSCCWILTMTEITVRLYYMLKYELNMLK